MVIWVRDCFYALEKSRFTFVCYALKKRFFLHGLFILWLYITIMGFLFFLLLIHLLWIVFFIDTWRVHYLEIGGMVRTFVSNDVVLHQSTEMQQMMQLTISEARKEWNEDTTCDDPILVRECQWYRCLIYYSGFVWHLQ